MPRFAANLSMMFTEVPFLDRFDAAAKAGFTAFLSGLRNRLARAGVRVVTIKPGFVRTRMTAGMKLPGPLTAEPKEVAAAIFAAAEAKTRRDVKIRDRK